MTRNEAIRWLELIEKKYIHGGDESYDEARKEALHMAIEALERKTGRWELIDDTEFRIPGYRCSVCRCECEDWQTKPTYKYCPNCGAYMTGGDHD